MHSTIAQVLACEGLYSDLFQGGWNGAYVRSQDIVGDGRLVDGRVLVRLEVDEGLVRDTFGSGHL